MDTHQILKSYIRTELKANILDYCYTKVGDKNAIEIDIPKEDYDKVSPIRKISIGEWIFKRILMGKENKDGSLTFTYIYQPNENMNYQNDITAEGIRKYGVISPEGKFYECDYSGHNNLEYWLKERGLISDSPDDHSFDYFGWIKLTGSYLTECEFVFQYKITDYDFTTKKDIIIKENKPTKAQFDVIKKYIEARGRTKLNYNYMWYDLDELDELFEKGDDMDFRYAKGGRTIENGQDELNK